LGQEGISFQQRTKGHRDILMTPTTTRFLIALIFSIVAVNTPGWTHPTNEAAAQSLTTCSAFNSRIWAQTVFEDDPGVNRALDPDNDGLACEELPLGIAPALWAEEIPADAIPVDLVSVTDGDSINVVYAGQREQVRLVGIDTHESGGPYQDVECYGPEAADFLTRLLAIGGTIALEEDVEDRDQYGRMLRWVWADFGTGQVYLLNEALLRAGYAERFRDTPNRRYLDALLDAEEFARDHALGLWSACESRLASQSFEPTPQFSGGDKEGSRPGCDPAYPDVCIPSPPPDLQCSDIPFRKFRVLPPDPHNFDGNLDGVACEGP